MNRDEGYKKIMSRIFINDNGCHIWMGAKNDSGYGVQKIDNKFWYVHRFVYDYIYGITEGMSIDHICKNPLCCNINHLKELTFKENTHQGSINSANRRRKVFCEKHNIKRIKHKDCFSCPVCMYEYYLFRKNLIRVDITYDDYIKLKHNKRKQKEKIICCGCGKEFYDIPCKKRKYCSCKCAQQHSKNITIGYKNMVFKSIISFCEYVGISKTTFYRIKNKTTKNKIGTFIVNGVTYG